MFKALGLRPNVGWATAPRQGPDWRLCHCPAWPSSSGASLWMLKGQLHSQKPAPQAGYGGSGSPKAALSFSRSTAVEPFMPHTSCRKAMSLSRSPKPVLSTCYTHSPRMGAWGMGEPGHLTTRDQIGQMRRQWCPGLQGGGKIPLREEGRYL